MNLSVNAENDVPDAIPDDTCPGILEINYPVSDSFTVNDVNLGINITHTYRSDLQVQLQSPQTTVVDLIVPVFAADSDDNFDSMLDDSSVNPLDDGDNDETAAPYFDRTVAPANPLSTFNGEDALGIWVVKICDDAFDDTGTYNRSRLTLRGFEGSDMDPAKSASACGIAIADFNGDGSPDVVEASASGFNDYIYYNDGTDSFLSAEVFSADQFNQYSTDTADFDLDGDPDLVISDGTVTRVYVNQVGGELINFAGLAPINAGDGTCGLLEVTQTFNVTDSFTANDLDMVILVTHPYRSRTVVTIKSPNLNTLPLINGTGLDTNAN